MPATKKKKARKVLKKRQKTVVVISSEKDPKDILFPEKVAKAKKIFENAIIDDPRFSASRRKD